VDTTDSRHYSGGVIPRRIALFVLVALVAPLLRAEPVTILLDASYSMSLPAGTGTRLEALSARLFDWLASQPPNTRYALLVAEQGSDVDLRLPYPASARQVLAEIAETVPWGSIDLGRALTHAAGIAASIASANGDPGARLLLITDAEDIAALMPGRQIRLPAGIRYESIRLTPRTPASVASFVDRLSDLPDTRLASPEPSAVPAPSPDAPPAPVGDKRIDAATPPPDPTARAGLLARWARPARWVFAVAALLGSIAVLRARARHRRRVARATGHNERPPEVPMEIRGSGGRARTVITSFPATLTTSGLRVEHPDLARVEQTVRLEYTDGRIVLHSDDKVKVNGVPRTDHELGDRDQVRIGAVRVVIGEIHRVKPVRVPRPTHRRYPLAPASAAAACIAAFLLAPPQISVAPLRAAAGAPSSSSGPHTVVADTVPDAAPARDEPGTARAAVSAGSLSAAVAPLPVLRLPRVIDPTDDLPAFDADYVAIHAHPDDEALDFGAAVATMSAAGLRGAVILLTDGDAGLDQYPWRETGANYPAYDMRGDELARVRVAEAREAIGWIGAEYYVRLGLPNHPYSSIEEVLTIDEVIERWGGREAVVARLSRIVERLSPEIVISPDGPTAALEHFEHEATGVLVREALRSLAQTGTSPVRAHLVTVDPLQIDLEPPELVIIPWTPAADGTLPRMRQLFALRAHRTQRDSTVIGVETRLAIPGEYYRLAAVEPGFNPERYLEQIRPYRSSGRPDHTVSRPGS